MHASDVSGCFIDKFSKLDIKYFLGKYFLFSAGESGFSITEQIYPWSDNTENYTFKEKFPETNFNLGYISSAEAGAGIELSRS